MKLEPETRTSLLSQTVDRSLKKKKSLQIRD
jgi:hypothetical protein